VSRTRKAVTRGCTDHFAAGVTYLQFPVEVCFSYTFPELVFLISLSAENGHFPQAITYNLDL